MGNMLNASGDLLPPEPMYEACRIVAQFVRWRGDLEWDFSRLHTMEIPREFTDLLDEYLQSVTPSKSEVRGWKLPETTLVYPWLVRLYPDMFYVFWIRNPRDCILGQHITDDMRRFGVECPETDDERLRRAISWKYQYEIVRSTPRPANWIEVRFEDFVLKQEETLVRLEKYLGIPMAHIITNPESVGRFKTDDGVNYFRFFEESMREHGYELPEEELRPPDSP